MKFPKFPKKCLALVFLGLVPAYCFAGYQTFVSPGSTSFTVPAGVTQMMVTLIGGGGGGGGSDGSGDNHSGGGGGSGGYIGDYWGSRTITVIPGATISVTVGAGGTRGAFTFNGSAMCNNSGSTGTKNGGSGGTTQISGSFGTLTATGGQGGIGNTGDNGNGAAGAGGTPNGIAGGSPATTPYNWNERNHYVPAPGGDPSPYTGYPKVYGGGGDSNGVGLDDTAWCPTNGYPGAVAFSWVDPAPTVNVQFSWLKKLFSFIW